MAKPTKEEKAHARKAEAAAHEAKVEKHEASVAAEREARRKANKAGPLAKGAPREVVPVDATITESQWKVMLGRQSQEDAKWLFAVTAQSGGPNIVPDPEPVEEEPVAAEA